MAISATILMIMSFVLSKDLKSQFRFSPKDVALGLGSAVVLWCIFYFGDFFSKLIFDFALRPQVDSIYAMKEGQNKKYYLYWDYYLSLVLPKKFSGKVIFSIHSLVNSENGKH